MDRAYLELARAIHRAHIEEKTARGHLLSCGWEYTYPTLAGEASRFHSRKLTELHELEAEWRARY